jgi:hypothetical protein
MISSESDIPLVDGILTIVSVMPRLSFGPLPPLSSEPRPSQATASVQRQDGTDSASQVSVYQS